MRAQLLKEPGLIETNPLELSEAPIPEPGAEDVRVQVQVCGVCHTDLHTVEGELELKKSPIIPGHQIVGRVEAIGSNVRRFSIGDRVGICWLNSACGECVHCKRGLENLCDNARFTGYHSHGGYADYTVAPASYAFPIPDGFPDSQAAPLLCAGIIGYRSLRLSNILQGQRLGLFGFGASAHITIQVATYWGCEVYVFTRSEEHQKHAIELGAAWTGDSCDTPPAEMDSCILFAPVGEIVPMALRALTKGGTLAINAIHMSPIPEIPYNLIYFERTIRSVANCTRQDAEELLKLADEIPIHVNVETYSLTKANEVLKRLKRSEVRGAAVLTVAE